MKSFKGDEISTFLRAVDRHLSKRFDLVIIGGAAAALSFGAESGTLDIDTLTGGPLIDKAVVAAKSTTGLSIPMGRVGIWEAPYEYESRLIRLPLKEARRLRIFVPEKHDWALMKISRLYLTFRTSRNHYPRIRGRAQRAKP